MQQYCVVPTCGSPLAVLMAHCYLAQPQLYALGGTAELLSPGKWHYIKQFRVIHAKL